MSDAFYSILPAIAAAISSIVLFLRIEKNNILGARNFFWHYALAFGIIAFTSIPIFLINLGIGISYNNLRLIYIFVILLTFISYLLFFRGTTLLFIKDRFFPTILPLFILPAAAIFTLVFLLFLNVSSIIVYTAFSCGFLFVNSNLLGSIFICSFTIGLPIRNIKRKFCSFLLGLGWFSILALDVILWISAVLYHPELWILKIISFKSWFFARAIIYLIITIGVLFSAKYLQYPEYPVQEDKK